MGHTWKKETLEKKVSHFEKWFTLGEKIGYERWPVWRGQNKSKYMVERWSCREVFKIKLKKETSLLKRAVHFIYNFTKYYLAFTSE